MRIVLAALFAVLLGVPAIGQTGTQIAEGLYGGACRKAEPRCDQGVCDQRLDICVSCGLEGAPACIGHDGEPVCTFPSYGYRAVSLGGRQLYCFAPDHEDCGHVGMPACDRESGAVCYSGVPVVAASGQAFCGACGDYGQPCCPDGSCDYGSCQSNVCLPDKQAGATGQGGTAAPPPVAGGDRAAILAAIRDCRLSEARALHAKADPNASWYDEVTRFLTDAIERENKVRALYDRALAKQAEARRLSDEGNDRALAAFQQAEVLFVDGRALTGCDATRAVLDEAIAINRRNSARARGLAQVAQAKADIKACHFSAAQGLLDAVPSGTAGLDEAMTQLEEARNREARVEKMYEAARNLHDLADQRAQAGDLESALEILQDARQGFVNARQLTRCDAYRDRITQALRTVGGSIEKTEDMIAANAANRMPPRYTGPATSAPSSGQAHPCLDPSVPVDASASFYAQYAGGGQASYGIKGQYLCDPPFKGAEYALLGGGSMTIYDCTREGNRFVDCRATETINFTDVRPEGNGTGYFWGKKGAWKWMIVVDR